MWIARILILATTLLLVAALAWWAGWWVMLLPAVVVAYAVAAVAVATWRGSQATRAFRAAHPDKRLLLAYSDSPRWKDYIEREWIPRWGDRAVVVDCSRPGVSTATAAHELFRSVGGPRRHNPLAIVVPSAGPITAIRFRRAFQELETGNDAALRSAETRLSRALGETEPG